MARKLSDSELAERVRDRSKVRSAKRRENLSRAGRAQMLIWVPATLKTALETTAAERGNPVGPVYDLAIGGGWDRSCPANPPDYVHTGTRSMNATRRKPENNETNAARQARLRERRKAQGFSESPYGCHRNRWTAWNAWAGNRGLEPA